MAGLPHAPWGCGAPLLPEPCLNRELYPCLSCAEPDKTALSSRCLGSITNHINVVQQLDKTTIPRQDRPRRDAPYQVGASTARLLAWRSPQKVAPNNLRGNRR